MTRLAASSTLGPAEKYQNSKTTWYVLYCLYVQPLDVRICFILLVVLLRLYCSKFLLVHLLNLLFLNQLCVLIVLINRSEAVILCLCSCILNHTGQISISRLLDKFTYPSPSSSPPKFTISPTSTLLSLS